MSDIQDLKYFGLGTTFGMDYAIGKDVTVYVLYNGQAYEIISFEDALRLMDVHLQYQEGLGQAHYVKTQDILDE